jgi:hypothetical protein
MFDSESNEQPLAASNSKNRSSKDILLPLNYQPSKYSVVLGRGRACRKAEGNHHMGEIVKDACPKYSKATSKQAKSEIVTTVVNTIHMKCPDGAAFVRLVNGRWNEVGEHVAREKVGYLFRELIHEKYHSSTKSRMARRRLEQDQSILENEQQQPSLTFSSAQKSLEDMPTPMKNNFIIPSMYPLMEIMQPLPEPSRDLSRIDKVLQDGFRVIADAEKALGYGQAFAQTALVLNPRKGEEATRKRDFSQEAYDILCDPDIGTEDLSDFEVSNVFDFF